MAKIYYDNDADLSLITSKTVGVIGYGIQGRGQALNLRDSGVKVVVSQRPGGPNYEIAKKDGFQPVEASEAARRSDIVIILAQDPLQTEIYKNSVLPHLTKGKALAFSHGFNIHFKQIVPPKFVDVFMVAPKGPGSLVRRLYEEGKGVPCLVAVHQDATKNCKKIALAYAKALGGTRAGVIETTFKEETETDLFGEQTVLCGGVSALIKAGFETLVRAGYQPEVAYFECLHELKLITDMIYASGIQGMRKRVSDTAEYGDVTRGPRVVNQKTRQEMKKILSEIQKGKFAREFLADYKSGKKNFEKLRHADDKHPIEEVGAKLRGMMKWM
ncbi:MAG: ketol-acid reductoisomerase [Candidatus Omnitrophica bacterium]|nr:ketol-acid reductoisomerase [Candidatus Omnitrophota bacterium]